MERECRIFSVNVSWKEGRIADKVSDSDTGYLSYQYSVSGYSVFGYSARGGGGVKVLVAMPLKN